MTKDKYAVCGDYNMTDIFLYCATCNKEDGGETLAENVKIVNGMVVFELVCGHKIIERFKFP